MQRTRHTAHLALAIAAVVLVGSATGPVSADTLVTVHTDDGQAVAMADVRQRHDALTRLSARNGLGYSNWARQNETRVDACQAKAALDAPTFPPAIPVDDLDLTLAPAPGPSAPAPAPTVDRASPAAQGIEY